MELDPIGQYRPAPQFEQQQIAETAATPRIEPPDLDAMALRLDLMKIDAAIDAERTRPGLNGFFALVLVSGLGYVGLYLAQYQTRALAAAAHGDDVLNAVRVVSAIGIGMLAAVVVGIWSFLATRRVRRAVQAYERELLALGGTPLPERGMPLHPHRAKGAERP